MAIKTNRTSSFLRGNSSGQRFNALHIVLKYRQYLEYTCLFLICKIHEINICNFQFKLIVYMWQDSTNRTSGVSHCRSV